jgi:RNA polymerase sigma factor (sigma-70 family)
MEADPDGELAASLQAGNDAALNALIERYREPLFRFLFRYTRDETAARDLAQETFVRAYFNIGSFTNGRRFSTWLFQIALNLSRDRARSKHGRRAWLHLPFFNGRADDEIELEVPDRSVGPSTQLELTEATDAVRKAIDALPDELRATFVLSVLEERSQQDTAEILGITPKAVETRIYRARRILAQQLERHRAQG